MYRRGLRSTRVSKWPFCQPALARSFRNLVKWTSACWCSAASRDHRPWRVLWLQIFRHFGEPTNKFDRRYSVRKSERKCGHRLSLRRTRGFIDLPAFSTAGLLKVSPTSSVMKYKGSATDVAQVSKELKVDAVMSGRLTQRRGDDLSISVQLIDARTEKVIWAEQYD